MCLNAVEKQSRIKRVRGYCMFNRKCCNLKYDVQAFPLRESDMSKDL